MREALAAARAGDTLVVTKLDRLVRSVRDAHAIADELTAREVKLNIGGIGGSVYDPTDPIGRLLFTRCPWSPIRGRPRPLRTREGMAVAEANGRLRGNEPKLSPSQETHLLELHPAGRHTTTTELAELFTAARSTVYGAIQRAASQPPAPG